MRAGHGAMVCITLAQDVLRTACSADEAGTGLPQRLRQAILLMLSAAPPGSSVVKDVLAAAQHGLEEACQVSLLPELILSLLRLPEVCQVSVVAECDPPAAAYCCHTQPS